jgi:hypothetical protein
MFLTSDSSACPKCLRTVHFKYQVYALHGHRNPDRAWEEPSCSSTRPVEIEAWMQTPLSLGTSPFSWTCGRGRFGRRPGGRECSVPPRPTQNARLPLSSRMPPLPPLASQPCARPLTRGNPETPRMPNAAPHVCACSGRPLVRGPRRIFHVYKAPTLKQKTPVVLFFLGNYYFGN